MVFLQQVLWIVYFFPKIYSFKIETTKSDYWDKDLPKHFESDRIQVQALIVSENSESFSHWNSIESLDAWLKRFAVPGISGIDTRRLTKILREHGTMLGKIEIGNEKLIITIRTLKILSQK